MSTALLAAALTHLRTEATPRDADRCDRQLLHDYTAANDPTAFAALVRRHGSMVLAVCRRVLRHEQDAEDAFQAVFLVLARKAATLRNGDVLTSWLHGVSYRVALRARRAAARRRKHESRVEPKGNPVAWEAAWRELQAILDEEIEKLPAVYRGVFVLCCLEGLSGPQAADRLGVKENTVFSRLARARKRLQQRLARRGISLAAVLAALAVSGAGRAAPPGRLMRATAAAACRLGTGAPPVGFSANVRSLAEGVIATMRPNKTTLATVLLMVCALGTGLSLFAREATKEAVAPPLQRLPRTSRAPAVPLTPTKATGKTVAVKGRVLDPDGKGLKGAKVHLLDFSPGKTAPAVRALSGPDGTFRFTFAEADVKMPPYGSNWPAIFLVATAEGFGPALAPIGEHGRTVERMLRLVKDDVPIKGRVLDLEGRPVAGARTVVFRLMVPKDSDLTAFLKDLEGRTDGYPAEYNLLTVLDHPGLSGLFPPAIADKDGRFQFRGIGRERIAGLMISGPSIETRQVRVRTRPGAVIRRLEWKDHPRTGDLTYYGATFTHTVPPTRPVTGVVRDKATGKPLAGATVESVTLAGSNFHGTTFVRTTADGQGRYRLVGLPRGAGNLIRALPPEGRPYLRTERGVPAPPGLVAVSVDFELKRGVWVEGKVVDKMTGKAVKAGVEYFLFKDNPHRKDVAGLDVHQRVQTAADGTFRFLGLPGRGLVAARADGDRYLVGVGEENSPIDAFGYLTGTSPPCHATGYHGFTRIDPAVGANSVACKVVLDPGRTLTGTVLGPDGKPLSGARPCGLTSYAFTGWSPSLETAAFTAFGLGKGKPRNLVFLHEAKKVAGSLLVRGDEKGPVTVKLEPWGAVAGRLVAADGLARPKVELTLRRFGPRLTAADSGVHPTRSFYTDKDGHFRIEGLVPSLKYTLTIMRNGTITGSVVKDLSIKSGETRELGDIQGSE